MKFSPVLFISFFNIFLAFLLLINNFKNNRSIFFLSSFLVIYSINAITGSLLVDGGPVWLLALLLNNFAPFYYLFPVLMYFYVRATVTDSIRFRKYDYLHFIPFFVNLIAVLPYLFTSYPYKYSIAENLICNFDAYMEYDFKLFYPHIINQFARPVQFFAYLIASIVLVIRFLPKLKVTTGLAKTQFRFMLISLISILLFFLILNFRHLFVTIHQVMNNDAHASLLQSQEIFRIFSGFYFILPLFILLNPRFLYGLPQKKENILYQETKLRVEEKVDDVNDFNNEKTVNEIETENFRILTEQILKFMEKERPYLNPKFSVLDICSELHVPRHHVQYCFNVIIKKRFADMKNEMRVNHAIELLLSDSFRNISIEGIGKNSGFASPSNFFFTFKKITGLTPNQWLEGKLNKPDLLISKITSPHDLGKSEKGA